MVRIFARGRVIEHQLLRNAAWTRRLARSLAGGDESLADDVVQDAWVQGLRRPPDGRGPVQPWLKTVIRRNVFNRARERRRREDRERRFTNDGSGSAAASPEQLLARLEAHRAVVQAVAVLPEPYRQTVLLRYFEGLSSAEVGDRMNVPAATVRGRLKTALDELREALDKRPGGREGWLSAVEDLATSGADVAVELTAAAGAPVAPAEKLAVLVPSRLARTLLATAVTGAVAASAAWLGSDETLGQWGRAPSPEEPAAPGVGAGDRSERPALIPDERRPVAPSTGAPGTRVAKTLTRAEAEAEMQAEARWKAMTGWRSAAPSGVTGGGGPVAKPFGSCRIATEGDGPVATACRKGGVAGAKKLMKKLLSDAKANGQRWTCEGCHRDLDSYELLPEARERLVTLVRDADRDAAATSDSR